MVLNLNYIDLFSNIISGFLGGLVVWLFQQSYINKRENHKKNFIKLSQSQKIIDKDIIFLLRPGDNLDIIKETLGNPMKVFNQDSPVFSDSSFKTKSFLYSFKNANVKITSEDNQSIDSITIFPNDETFDISGYTNHLNLNSNKLNKAKVNTQLISSSLHTFLAARHDYAFALNYNIANPLYLSMTLFGYSTSNFHEYFETKNPNLFLNGVITGICISNYTKDSYYIYQYELR